MVLEVWGHHSVIGELKGKIKGIKSRGIKGRRN